jgi:hypothetical protein
MTKIAPLSELSLITQIGKSLAESIVDHVMENGVNMKLEKMKEEMLSRDEINMIKKEFPTLEFLERTRLELQKTIDSLMMRISDFENGKKQLGTDITCMKSMFTEKVDFKDI